MSEDRSQPPPGFEWSTSVDDDGSTLIDRSSVVATEPLVEWAMSLRHHLVEGPRLKFTVEFAWQWRDRMLRLLGGAS